MRTRTRRSRLSCLLVLGAAQALAAVKVALYPPSTPDNDAVGFRNVNSAQAGGENSAAEEATKRTQQQQLDREFVTLRDIQLVGSAAGRAVVGHLSLRDDPTVLPVNLEQHKELVRRRDEVLPARVKVVDKGVNNERSGEINVQLDGEDWKLLKPHVKMFEDQGIIDPMVYDRVVQAMLKKGKAGAYGQYGTMSDTSFRSTMMNVGRQGHSLDEVVKLMQGHGCTRVVLARPDVMFVNDIDTQKLLQCNMPNNTWYIPDFAHCGGINDRLAFVYLASLGFV